MPSVSESWLVAVKTVVVGDVDRLVESLSFLQLRCQSLRVRHDINALLVQKTFNVAIASLVSKGSVRSASSKQRQADETSNVTSKRMTKKAETQPCTQCCTSPAGCCRWDANWWLVLTLERRSGGSRFLKLLWDLLR